VVPYSPQLIIISGHYYSRKKKPFSYDQSANYSRKVMCRGKLLATIEGWTVIQCFIVHSRGHKKRGATRRLSIFRARVKNNDILKEKKKILAADVWSKNQICPSPPFLFIFLTR
jgi:hypothetical protein